MRNYKVINEGNRYTIGQWDNRYQAYIINDGVYGYYYWNTEEEAQCAADAYNRYEGCEWLGHHGYGNDIINEAEIDDIDEEMVELYRLFNAIR
ncbi:MAG: hypothetical protein WCS56_04735 [Bacilli bacterium]